MAESYESMTRVVTETGFIARVWHDEVSEGDYDSRHNAVTELIRAHSDTKASIATAIRTLPAWAAYEIVDRFGNGRVVYKDWP